MILILILRWICVKLKKCFKIVYTVYIIWCNPLTKKRCNYFNMHDSYHKSSIGYLFLCVVLNVEFSVPQNEMEKSNLCDHMVKCIKFHMILATIRGIPNRLDIWTCVHSVVVYCKTPKNSWQIACSTLV